MNSKDTAQKKWYQYGVPASTAAWISLVLALFVFVMTLALGATGIIPRFFVGSGFIIAGYFLFGFHIMGVIARADGQHKELKERISDLEQRLPK